MQHASILPPAVLTLVAAIETRLLTGVSSQVVNQLTVAVRSMGGGSYIGLGLKGATEMRLIAIGDSFTFEGPTGTVFDAGLLFAYSDGAAVLEITGIVPED